MATKALNYTAAEIDQRLELAGTAVQPNALNDYYTKTEVDGKVVVDLSARYNTSYANLSAALTALNSDATATNIKKGGVSIKFINSTTNKYEQWSLNASSWSINTSDWGLTDDSLYVADADVSSTDLDISDENKHVLARFFDGHFKTKNFDSSKIRYYASYKYFGKIVSILGDSISTFGTPDSRNQQGTYCHSYYPTETCRYSELGNVTEGGVTFQSIKFNVEDTWWMRVINMLGAALGQNESWRGSRVSGTSSNIFASQTRINHLGENGNPNLIIVHGGTNDAGATNGMTPEQLAAFIGTFNTENPANYTNEQIAALPTTTFADAYRTMLIRLQKTYPEAEIVVILPTFTTTYYTITNLDLIVEVIKEACDFFGVKYIDIRTCGITCFNKNTYLVDGIHPNYAGMKLIADKVLKGLIYN